MKKTIKILSIILIALVILSNISYAIEEDTEAPVINSITMSTKNVKAGEDITFSVNTTDNLAGTHQMSIEWHLEGSDGQDQNRLIKSFSNITNNIFEETLTIPASTLPGNWETYAIQVWDALSNYKCIYTWNTEEIDITTLDFTVENASEVDTEAPKLNSVRIVETNYEAPCTVTIEADISDNMSETIQAQIDYNTVIPKKIDWSNSINGVVYGELSGYGHNCVFSKQETGKYEAQITIPNKYIKYYMLSIRLQDGMGNYVNYTYREDELKEVYGNNNYVHLDTNLDLTPTNYEKDTTAPVLKEFLHNKTIMQTPALLETTIKVEEKESLCNFVVGRAFFRNEDGTFNKAISILRKTASDGTVLPNEHSAKLEFSRYENPGEIYVYRVELIDDAGNTSYYSIEDGTLEKQVIKVISDETKYTLETSNRTEDYIQQIAQLPEGSTVLCNIATNKIIKKELFDAIKGKDIKITFEDVYGYTYNSKGIQWILNGKDIVNETKDIDMTVNMWVRSYCPYLLDDYKFPEYKDGEKVYEEYQIEVLTDYFNYLKTKGYKNTDNYLEKAKKLLHEMQDGGYDIESLIMESTWFTKYLSIEFANNGLLPAEFIVRIKPEYATRNIIGAKDLFLFYVNGNKFEQVMENVGLAIDDYYDLKISHNSEYWLINEPIRLAEMETEGDGKVEQEQIEQEEIIEKDTGKGVIAESTDKNTPKTGVKMYLTEAIVMFMASTIVLIIAVKVKKAKKSKH